MSSLEFALSVLTVLVLFLAFALAVTATLLGGKQSQAEVRKLFQIVVKNLFSVFSKD
jgi:hypothetical protein